jgi:hypothetical protein
VSVVDEDGYDWATLGGEEPAAPEEGQPAEAQDEPAEEAVTAEAEPERPRNPDGTFAKKPDPQVEAVLQKYGGDTETALKALAESQSYIGSLHQELGGLRQELANAAQAWQNPRPQQDFESLLEENPQQAALMALNAGDHAAYQRAKQEWNDISPGAPDLFEANLRLQRQVQDIQQQVQAVSAPVQQQQQIQSLASVYRQVASENPDFEELRPAMVQVVNELADSGYDWITPAIESGDLRQAYSAMTTMVKLARAHEGGNLASAAQAAARQHVAETEAAKREAIVASATSTVASDDQPRSPADALWDQWAEHDIGRLRDS